MSSMLATLLGATHTGRTSLGRATGGSSPGVSRPTILMPAWTTTAAEGQFRVQASDTACIEAIAAVGGEVVLVPLRSPFAGEDALGLVLQRVLSCDGLFIPGSAADVNPRYYQQLPHPRTSAPNGLLDWWVMVMTLVARASGIPVLGVCGGAQRMSVALGGTLQQDLPGHRAEPVYANNYVRTPLHLELQALAWCLGSAQRAGAAPSGLPNEAEAQGACMHHQAFASLPPGALVWARAGTVVEGFGFPRQHPQAWFALGSLFHLEARPQDRLTQCTLSAFIRAARASASCRRARAARESQRLRERLAAEPLLSRFVAGPLPLAAVPSDPAGIHAEREGGRPCLSPNT
jgi:putative glutamine amidotransferase